MLRIKSLCRLNETPRCAAMRHCQLKWRLKRLRIGPSVAVHSSTKLQRSDARLLLESCADCSGSRLLRSSLARAQGDCTSSKRTGQQVPTCFLVPPTRRTLGFESLTRWMATNTDDDDDDDSDWREKATIQMTTNDEDSNAIAAPSSYRSLCKPYIRLRIRGVRDRRWRCR
jgi:hypothetical protein